MPTLLALTLLITIQLQIGQGAIHQSFSEAATALPYDFVIAGGENKFYVKSLFHINIISGGTAGSVIANRLTENPKFRVLVIEAGPSNEGVLNIEVPGLSYSLRNSPFDWNYTTVPQSGLNGRTLSYPSGHVLGGSSSISALAYTRGSSDDYNRWAAVTGDEGWSWDQMLPFILKNEHFYFPVDGHSIVGQFDPKFHNFTGMSSVSLSEFERPLDSLYLQTSQYLNDEFPFDLDVNDGIPLGLGWVQCTIGNGTRSIAATSYLGPRFINRPNLDVVVNTHISRVLDTGHGRKIDLRTIEFFVLLYLIVFYVGENQTRHTVTARKEVILSLGSIGTPHILMNSGIGDGHDLKKIGIKPVLHLPSVGKNLSDYTYMTLSWSADLTAKPENTTDELEQWTRDHSGPFANGIVNLMAWSRVPTTASNFTLFADPASGPYSPHYQFILVIRITGGSVSLKSSDPFDMPLIDPALLMSETDVFIAKDAISSVKMFFSGPAWHNIVLDKQPLELSSTVTEEDTVDQIIRNISGTRFHAVGTAAMSPRGTPYGMVEPDLLLKGAEALRIVDASIMPFIPAGNTLAATYAIAERGAELIKQKWV
ncbi:pyranose dehydrogenase [Cyathus striatus]|nr:pyranose dehydrogenase [Cyathus striatus]